uniref:Secreted protein n=1 Tax=Setaria viridis TaxID=4556 RepID=A0A4U6UXY9_SETVI|nr:hypothetical protein SEVIR_4G035801v2 [Setaria viridis]
MLRLLLFLAEGLAKAVVERAAGGIGVVGRELGPFHGGAGSWTREGRWWSGDGAAAARAGNVQHVVIVVSRCRFQVLAISVWIGIFRSWREEFRL